MFYFLAKDKQHIWLIYMERNKSFIYTHFIFELESYKLFKNNFLS